MRLLTIIFLTSAICSCSASFGIAPIGGASKADLEAQAQAIERAFKVVDARLKKIEVQDEEK